jgi:hypothetical protein
LGTQRFFLDRPVPASKVIWPCVPGEGSCRSADISFLHNRKDSFWNQFFREFGTPMGLQVALTHPSKTAHSCLLFGNGISSKTPFQKLCRILLKKIKKK